MFIPFPRPHSSESVATVPSNAPSLMESPSMPGQHLSPSPIPNNHNGGHHDHAHHHSHSGSQMPSPLLSPSYLPSGGPAQMEQNHHSRPRVHSHSSDYNHHYHHPHHSHRTSHSQSHSNSKNGSRSATPAPPLLMSQNSEPVGPYVSVPPHSYPGADYQPPYATQPAYEHTPAPASASVPMPTEEPYGATSSQYPPATGAPFEPPVESRGLDVSQDPRSRGRKPLVSQEMDAPDPIRRTPPHHPLFRHSRCSGRRKALCVGINYVGQRNSLQGCVDDARNIYQFLLEHQYSHSNIIVLTDDNANPSSQPTRKNFLNAMRWLVEDARSDDALFFHYSGHGGRTRDTDGHETDGWDEVVFPVDYQKAGIITDNLLHDSLVKPLPPGCRLTAVFDSCHSESILDLVFEFHSNGQLKSSPVAPAFVQAKSSPADVVCFSGCKDSQTSADVVQGGVAVGAMSYAFLKVIKRNPNITYIDLLRGVREILKKKYSQKPQLTATHKVDKNLHFLM